MAIAKPRAILYLSHDGLTDPLGQSQILPYLAGLSDVGYRFDVISFEKKGTKLLIKNQVSEICKEKNITWHALVYHKYPPVLSTLFDLWKLRRKAHGVLKSKNISIIHCRSYPPSLVGLPLAKKHGLKFIFDMRGFWADERVEGKIWNLKNPLYRKIYTFFKRKEQIFLTESDAIISLTYRAKRFIESKGTLTPITVIPTCVDLNLFDRSRITIEDKQSLKSSLGISVDEFVLVYLGSWGTWYLTQEMLLFFKLIRERVKAKFLIISPDQIDTMTFPYTQDVIVRAVNRKEVPGYLAIANAAIAFIKPSFSKIASSATKFGEYAAMGVPTIVNGGWGDIEDVSLKNVVVLRDVSLDTLTMEVNRILSIKEGISKPHESDLRPFSLTHGVCQYQAVYDRLIEGE